LRPASVGFQCPDCVAAGQAGVRRARGAYGGQLVQRTGLVTVVLAVLNVAVFVVTAVTAPGGFAHNEGSTLFGKLELTPFRVAESHEYWRLISAAFLHIGPLHLVVNMVALGIVGPALERVFGHWRFTGLYLLSALGGSVSVYLFDPRGAAGASGAIYGLFAATVIVLRKLGLDPRTMIITIVINFAISLAPGISLFGHLGGFVIGALAALALVYAPRGPGRTSTQILAFGVLLAVLVGLVIYHTQVLTA
jgi:membrane associated rhomboid family serine protease